MNGHEGTSLFRALANDERRSILSHLSSGPEAAMDLYALSKAGISQPMFSKHLQVLAAAGLVTRKQEGKYVIYWLDRRRVKQAKQELMDILSEE